MTEDQAYVSIWNDHTGPYITNVGMADHTAYTGTYVEPWIVLNSAPFRAGPRTTVVVHSLHYHKHSAGYFRSMWERAL